MNNKGLNGAPGEFELPTPRFVVWCSIQLSYGRVQALAAFMRTRERRRV